MTTEIFTPSNNKVFTEDEVQSILNNLVIIGYQDSLLCRIDGITWYEVQREENNYKKELQYSITLHCHYGMYCESYTHTYSYVETLNFLRAFNTTLALAVKRSVFLPVIIFPLGSSIAILLF